jgi:hypothetical protein
MSNLNLKKDKSSDVVRMCVRMDVTDDCAQGHYTGATSVVGFYTGAGPTCDDHKQRFEDMPGGGWIDPETGLVYKIGNCGIMKDNFDCPQNQLFTNQNFLKIVLGSTANFKAEHNWTEGDDITDGNLPFKIDYKVDPPPKCTSNTLNYKTPDQNARWTDEILYSDSGGRRLCGCGAFGCWNC